MPILVKLPNGSLRFGENRVTICVADTNVKSPGNLQDPALNESVLQLRKVGRAGGDAQCSEVRQQSAQHFEIFVLFEIES